MAKMIVRSIGTALPTNVIEQQAAYQLACQYSNASSKQKRVLKELYRRTSINKRHNVGLSEEIELYQVGPDKNFKGPSTSERMTKYKEEIVPLAISASRKAILDGPVKPEQFTHLITISCTGFFAPGFDFKLINALGLPTSIARFHLGFMGCNGALNGLNLAKTIIEANPNSKVLLCAAELCSLHYQYGWQSDHLVANSLFADCAAALVAEADHQALDRNAINKVVSSASLILPDSEKDMTWTIGDNGFKMTLSPEVPLKVAKYLPSFLDNWLESTPYNLKDIQSYAVHPGGPRVLRSVKSCLQLNDTSLATSEAVLEEYGNMSSPTVLFVLERLRNIKANGPCLCLAFGPGLVIEACLIQ